MKTVLLGLALIVSPIIYAQTPKTVIPPVQHTEHYPQWFDGNYYTVNDAANSIYTQRILISDPLFNYGRVVLQDGNTNITLQADRHWVCKEAFTPTVEDSFDTSKDATFFILTCIKLASLPTPSDEGIAKDNQYECYNPAFDQYPHTYNCPTFIVPPGEYPNLITGDAVDLGAYIITSPTYLH